MKFLILLFCLSFGAQISWAKTVYYKAESKISGDKEEPHTNYSIGQIDITPDRIDYLDYMYEKAGMPLTKTQNYLKVFDQKRGVIFWVEPKRDQFWVDLVYTNGKLTGQSANFKDPQGRSSVFKSTLTDKEYSYSLDVFTKDGKKVYTMNSSSKFITKEEFDKTLKELQIFEPKAAPGTGPKSP